MPHNLTGAAVKCVRECRRDDCIADQQRPMKLFDSKYMEKEKVYFQTTSFCQFLSSLQNHLLMQPTVQSTLAKPVTFDIS